MKQLKNRILSVARHRNVTADRFLRRNPEPLGDFVRVSQPFVRVSTTPREGIGGAEKNLPVRWSVVARTNWVYHRYKRKRAGSVAKARETVAEGPLEPSSSSPSSWSPSPSYPVASIFATESPLLRAGDYYLQIPNQYGNNREDRFIQCRPGRSRRSFRGFHLLRLALSSPAPPPDSEFLGFPERVPPRRRSGASLRGFPEAPRTRTGSFTRNHHRVSHVFLCTFAVVCVRARPRRRMYTRDG